MFHARCTRELDSCYSHAHPQCRGCAAVDECLWQPRGGCDHRSLSLLIHLLSLCLHSVPCFVLQEVLGEKGRRIRELQSLVQKRFGFEEGQVELFAERVSNRGLSAQAQADSLKYKLLGGLAVRRACYGIIRFVMEAGAKGVEVVVAGKLRGQRAKAMKFRDGYMMKTGNSAVVFQDYATRHVMMRQGIMGVRVKIMLPHDPTGVTGPKTRLADVVEILQPKE